MNFKRAVFRAANRFLEPFKLTVQPITRDFDARIDQPEQITRMLAALADAFDAWNASQTIFARKTDLSARVELEDFYRKYLTSSHRNKSGGSRFNNLAFLFLIAKSTAPAVVIDSGTFTGSSAWAFALGAPDATILSFDIDLSGLKERMPNVRYFEEDWTAFDWTKVDLRDSVIYFDDHVDQVRRLLEAADRKIPVAIFDDDFPVGAFAAMAHGGDSLPKIEFVLDESLRRQTALTWVANGKTYSWAVPHERLDRAKAVIAATERLPNTSLVTGVHQTPYRLVRLAEQTSVS